MQLCKDILTKAGKYKIQVVIFNDNTDESYDEVYAYMKNEWPWEYSFVRYRSHFGKPKYWMMINEAFGFFKTLEFDYLIQIPDDIQLVDGFFDKAVKTFEAIPDKYKSCLNLLQDVSRKGALWTPIEPKIMILPNGKVIRTGWVDMCYIANKYFFNILNWCIHPVNRDWAKDPNKSSGVGKQISERVYRNGTYFYQVEKSLVFHGTHDSVMHPVHRKITPLVTNYNINDVVCGVASILEREASLAETVKCILPQVGKLYVYLNRYNRVPAFLRHAKIQTFLSKDHAGDLGDVGKFYGLFDIKNKYLLTIDDDLIYASNYVAVMVSSIERYYRRAVISSHGRTFENLPVTSYYHGHTKSFACLREQKEDVYVHVAGTGVMGFHSSTLQLCLEDFSLINMADIFVGVKCHKLNIPMVAIAHKVGFVTESKKYDRDYTIYNFCHRNDTQQTKLINSIPWRKLT